MYYPASLRSSGAHAIDYAGDGTRTRPSPCAPTALSICRFVRLPKYSPLQYANKTVLYDIVYKSVHLEDNFVSYDYMRIWRENDNINNTTKSCSV